ncbi:MAG: hypothetical protein ACTSUE_25755, partial [Promethearchaeota archaeon]
MNTSNGGTNGGSFNGMLASSGNSGWWNAQWQYRSLYRINTTTRHSDFPVYLEDVNFTKTLEDLGVDTGVEGDFIPESLRVVEVNGDNQNEIPYELIPLSSGNYTVEWVSNGTLQAGENKSYYLYFNNTGAWTKPTYYGTGDYFNATFINASSWPRVVYYDTTYGRAHWLRNHLDYKNYFNTKGYITKNAPELKTWMDNKIAMGAEGSVVVMARDSIPDTVAENQSTTNTMRRYLDAGGRIIWVADWFLYYQAHAGGSETRWGRNGGYNILGVYGYTTSGNLALTTDGTDWGHSKDWPDGNAAMKRPVRRTDVTITFSYIITSTTRAAGWLKNFNGTYTRSGFMYIFPRSDFPGNDPAVQSDVWNMSRKYLSPITSDNIEKVLTQQYFVDLEGYVHDIDNLPVAGANVSLWEYNGTTFINTNLSTITSGTGMMNFSAIDPGNYSFVVTWELEGSGGSVSSIVANTSAYDYKMNNLTIDIGTNTTNFILHLEDLDGLPVEGARVEVFKNDSLTTSLANFTSDAYGNSTLRWFQGNYSFMSYFLQENVTGYEVWDTNGELNLTTSDLENIEVLALTNKNVTVDLSRFVIDVKADPSGDILLGAKVNFQNASLGYNVNLTVQGENMTFYWYGNSSGIDYNVSIDYLGGDPLFKVNNSALAESHIITLQSKAEYAFDVQVTKVDTFLDYNITVTNHNDSSTTEFLNNNETCTAYWNDLIEINLRYYYDNTTHKINISGAAMLLDVKEVSTTIKQFTSFTYSGGLYTIILNTSAMNASVGSQNYGKYFNMFFDASKSGFERNNSQFCTLNLIPYNTSLTVNTTSASLTWTYSMNISVYYNDTYHSAPISGATTSWRLSRPSTGESWNLGAMSEGSAGNYSLLFDSTPYELDLYIITIEVKKELYLIQELTSTINIVEIPTILNGTKIYHFTTSSIINQPWTFYLEYNRSDTGAPLDAATTVLYSWENQDTGSTGNGTLTNLGGGMYSFGFQGTELGTYEISASIHQTWYEEREAIITVIVGESDFDYNVSPTSKAIIANETAIYRVTVSDRYNSTLLSDTGLVQFVDPVATFATGVDIFNEGNGTYTIRVAPWNDTIQEGTFLLTFRINKTDYTSAFFYVSLTVIDWPIGISFSQPIYEVSKNEQLNISLTVVDTWNSNVGLENAMVTGEITGPLWTGPQYVTLSETANGVYYLMINSSDTLSSDEGTYTLSVNVSSDIPSLSTFNFTQTATVDFNINLRPMISSMLLNQTAIPIGNDFQVELTVGDGLNSFALLESQVLQLDVELGALNLMFNSSNWTYSSGVFTFNISTISLPVGQYALNVSVMGEASLYLDGNAIQNIWVVQRTVQAFATANRTSFPFGQDISVSVQLLDVATGLNLTEANITGIQLVAGSVTEM